jgi:hypothetical protein
MKLFLVIALLLGAVRGALGQASGLLVGDVVARETGAPLAHAMVSITSAGRQTFTSDGGTFGFREVPPGRWMLHVTHLGFAPADLVVEVPASGAAPRVKVMLTRLSVRLSMVKVIAKPSCTNPGRPDPGASPDLYTIVQQIRMNAEHYQLLADSFPFMYQVQREHRTVHADSSRSAAQYDTLNLRSDGHQWEYQLGDMIGRERNGTYVMHLPDLRDFARIQFLDNHCFWYAGLDSTREGRLIRIDFRVDDQIRTPDVNGTIFLDSATYQIRRADLELSKMLPQVPEITSVRVRTTFTEVAPSIVIIGHVTGTNTLRHGWGRWANVATVEEQRMMQFTWMGEDPRKAVVP